MSQRKSLSFYFALLVLVFVTLISGVQCLRTSSRKVNQKKNEQGSCSAVRNLWINKGLEVNQLPKLSMKNDSVLQICDQGPSCCTPAVEDKLISLASSEVSLDIALEKLKQSLNLIALRYNSFCVDLINKSAVDLDDMFQKTYGELYKQESKIFSDLFNQLRLYYSKGRDLDLIRVFDRFFRTLMQKMFALLNAHYSFDEKYLKCVVENMDALRPFHDVPQKLSNQVKRAMVAARTFHEGLKVGKEFVANVQKVKLTPSCVRSYARMAYCSACSGLNNLRPCSSYCSSVVNDCYLLHRQLVQPWSEYLGQMRKVMERLEGPFHLVGIISPINVKISEAIMNYQERNEDVNKKVFIGCGEPSLGSRSKRSYPSGEGGTRVDRSVDKSGSGDLDKILQEVRDKLLSSKDLFTDLNETSCTPLLTRGSKASSNSTPSDENCWNGTARARYLKPQVGEGGEEQSGTIQGDQLKDDLMMKQQIDKLSAVTIKLTKSFEGLDVIQEEDGAKGSGGGPDDEDAEGSGGSGLEDDEDFYGDFTTTASTSRRHQINKGFPPFNPITHRAPYHPRDPSTKSPYSRTFFNSAPSCDQTPTAWRALLLSSLAIYAAFS